MIRDFKGLPLMISRSSNLEFVKFVESSFNVTPCKLPHYIEYVIKSIDFLNNHTNDCFFSLPG